MARETDETDESEDKLNTERFRGEETTEMDEDVDELLDRI